MNLHMNQFHVRRKKFLWNFTRELVFVEMAEKKLVQDYYLVKKKKKKKQTVLRASNQNHTHKCLAFLRRSNPGALGVELETGIVPVN